ncbi:sensor histidine kinase [Pseudoduganella violaceinigra]|uniref:sensor histidine kinase n=1 Tax=Pseudoduganella violaceinigra TaxID=246602 RepID=UPI00041339BD|nr:HAMP domain-containing sensor histidine kinase [Pseudoduganella violaceinigra]
MTRSIAARLLRIIFGCYFLVTALVTAVQLTAEYKHTRTRVESEIEAMQHTFGPGIADAMWRFNDDIMRGILTGMKELPIVVGIKVVDDQGKLVRAVGTVLDEHGKHMQAQDNGRLAPPHGDDGLFGEIFSRQFPITYKMENGSMQEIGKWTVYSNRRIVVNQVQYGFFLILVNSVIKTLALWFIFVLVVRHWLGEPLQQLSDYVGHLNIGNLGSSPLKLQRAGNTELDLLANKINEMRENILAGLSEKAILYEELAVLNESLERRVAERTEAARHAQDELARSERLAALGSMVAGVAHELNTPIGNSLVAASTLHDKVRALAETFEGGMRRSDMRKFLDDAEGIGELLTRNIERAAGLVSSFKQVAVDRTTSKRRKFDLGAVIQENMDTMAPELRKTPYQVTVNVASLVAMDSYPGPLGQVLAALVNNAILHGFHQRAHGRIDITVPVPTGEQADIIIRDDGAGIASGNLNRIFDPFFTTRMSEGRSGLGLNIVHNIVTTILGGKIHVDSALGAGTTFRITIPLDAPMHHEEPIIPKP